MMQRQVGEGIVDWLPTQVRRLGILKQLSHWLDLWHRLELSLEYVDHSLRPHHGRSMRQLSASSSPLAH